MQAILKLLMQEIKPSPLGDTAPYDKKKKRWFKHLKLE